MRVWSATLAGLATSCLIEGVQLFLPTRYSTVSDLIANTTGALIGALIVAGWRRRRRQCSSEPSFLSDVLLARLDGEREAVLLRRQRAVERVAEGARAAARHG